MSILNPKMVEIDNLSNEQLENLMRYLNEHVPNMFGIHGRRYFAIEVRYSPYLKKNIFRVRIPENWIKQLSMSTTVDMIRQGMV